MNKEPLIEFSAIAGKIAIEHTKLHPVAKEAINWTIDQVADYLKREALSDIEKICNAAKKFDIDKVIAIPIGSLNGAVLVAIRAYGMKAEAFIKNLGMQIIPENSPCNLLDEICEKEKLFGVLIYEKRN